MFQPTKDLSDEHSGILLMLKIMDRVSEKLRHGKEISKDHLEKIAEFLKNFADQCHHGKEEGILFPELMKDPANHQLLNELLGEHKTGRDYIRGIHDSLPSYSPGSPEATHIALNMRGYIALLTSHIEKENNQLFPIADRSLPPALQEELVERFEALERDVIGEGKHEEYHGWLHELKEAYLD